MIQRIQRGRSDRLAAAAARERTFDDDSHLDMDVCFQTVPNTVAFHGILETEPHVTVIDGFLAPLECSELIAKASLQRRSGVSNDLGTGSESKGRSSSTALRTPGLVRALAPLRQRLTELLGVPEARLEGSMVLCYEVGGAYRWHFDAFNLSSVRGASNTAARHGGQRLLTSIAYLNDVPEGGETAFFHARRAIAPKAGRLLVFRNAVPRTAPDGRTRFEVDRRSLHAGLPVRAGTKWIVTTFVRERPRGMEEEP